MAPISRLLDPEVERYLLALDPMKPERIAEIRRWTVPFVAWCRDQGVGVGSARIGDVEAFRRFRGDDAKPAWGQTKWAVVRLVKAAKRVGVEPDRIRIRGFQGRTNVEARATALGRALNKVIARGSTPAARSSATTAIGRFLVWCDARGISARECIPGELALFRSALRADGMTSTDWVIAPTRALLRELAGAGVWPSRRVGRMPTDSAAVIA